MTSQSTSQKHKNFVSEKIGDKLVTDLPGIGEVLGSKLKDKGYEKAFNVLGQYLVLNKDDEAFLDWFKELISANSKQSNDCLNALKEYCDHYV